MNSVLLIEIMWHAPMFFRFKMRNKKYFVEQEPVQNDAKYSNFDSIGHNNSWQNKMVGDDSVHSLFDLSVCTCKIVFLFIQ